MDYAILNWCFQQISKHFIKNMILMLISMHSILYFESKIFQCKRSFNSAVQCTLHLFVPQFDVFASIRQNQWTIAHLFYRHIGESHYWIIDLMFAYGENHHATTTCYVICKNPSSNIFAKFQNCHCLQFIWNGDWLRAKQ